MTRIPIKKLTSGFKLPVYGMGLWRHSYKEGIANAEDKEERNAIEKAIELGVTHFDTAESYGDGHSETLFGSILKKCERQKLLVASKVSGSNQSYEDLKVSCEKSLQRLQTDYLDLYILHTYPDPGIDAAETMAALDDLVNEGLVKNIGVSNVTPNRFDFLQNLSNNKLVCNQVHYNVQCREAELEGVVAHCQAQDTFLVAWRPLQYGEVVSSLLLRELANQYGKTPSQIAFHWLSVQKNVAIICKTNNVEHLKENLGSFDWQLNPADIERITKHFPNQQSRSDAVPLNYPADIPV